MITIIKQKISRVLNKYGIHRKLTEQKIIAGIPFRAIKGTLRDTPDYDDAWIFNLSKHSKIIFDIGSNIGQSALLMIHHKEVQKVLLIDPNPTALAMAAENLIINQMMSMKAIFVPAFMSDTVGSTVEFYTVGAGAAGSRFKEHAKTATKLNEHFQVPTLTIDYLTNYYAAIPDLIKIDVEGAELEVLRGASVLCTKKLTTFFVEVHSSMGIVAQTESILQWCQANSYQAYYLKDHALLEVDQIKSRGRYHALLIPLGSSYPAYLKEIAQGASIA